MANVDKRWEFSAPKFVDFTNLQEEDQASTADEWFETCRESHGDMEYEPSTTGNRSSVAAKHVQVRDLGRTEEI